MRPRRLWIVALLAAGGLLSGGLVVYYSTNAGATGVGIERSPGAERRYKDCASPLPLYSVGGRFDGLPLTAIERDCRKPTPMVSESAGGIDPDSLHRNNLTTFLYGTCQPIGDSGCPYPLEIQVWPSCERNPAARAVSGGASTGGGPSILETSTVRGVPVYTFGGDEGSTRHIDRAEALVGSSTVVVYIGGDDSETGATVGTRGASLAERMRHVIAHLRPAGTSNAPDRLAAQAPSGALPAPAAEVARGLTDCTE